MKTPKSWKSTQECIELVEAMRKDMVLEIVPHNENMTEEWYWIIKMGLAGVNGVLGEVKIEAETTCTYQDTSANGAYQWAYKHLRQKRRKKRKKA